MSATHTPEPWVLSGHVNKCSISGHSVIRDQGGTPIGYIAYSDDASRAIACVNACSGMEDPAAEIAELKRQRDELLDVLGAAIPLIKQARLDWCDQNAESYDEDVVTPYDAILYSPALSLLENKGYSS